MQTLTMEDILRIANKESNNIKNKQIIDDIFDISKGLYNTYDDYVKHKQAIIEIVRKNNNQCFDTKQKIIQFTYYIEPVILNENDFNYIVSEYLDKKVILCKR